MCRELFYSPLPSAFLLPSTMLALSAAMMFDAYPVLSVKKKSTKLTTSSAMKSKSSVSIVSEGR